MLRLNYFNYFTEIEERFQQRRGSLLMLSTLDWSLIEIWRESGLPIEAVLRGIDNAFDKHDQKRVKAGTRTKKINGLAWCSQSVMEAAQAMSEAAMGASAATANNTESGFETERVAAYLAANAARLDGATVQKDAESVVRSVAARLRELAAEVASSATLRMETLEHTLTTLEEKLYSALKLAASEEEMVQLKEQAARELAPYRGKMQAVQIRQVQEQFLHKRLLEENKLPRLSLFYMGHA